MNRIYAGFWKRAFAFGIDTIILGLLGLVFFMPAIGLIGITSSLERSGVGDEEVGLEITAALSVIVGILAATLVKWLYYALMESSSRGATIGKMALGIRVTDLRGERITFGRATGRFFARYVSDVTLGLGYLITAFTQQKQALHDMLAGCLVVREAGSRVQGVHIPLKNTTTAVIH